MQILYLIAGTGMSADEQQRREIILNRVASKGTRVKVMALSKGPLCIESEEDEREAVQPLLDVMKTHESLYDAFITGCAGDAGLREARTVMANPVVGPGEASLLLGTAGHARFAMVTANPQRTASKYALTAQVGLDPSRLVASLSVNIPVLTMRQHPDKTRDALIHACLSARDSGAEVVLLGCMSMAFAGQSLIQAAEQASGLRIVNPVVAAVKMAESLCALRQGI